MIAPEIVDWGSVSPSMAGFRGRRRELRQIRSDFAHGVRVVSLTGAGGMGKSTLAKRFAEECGDLFDAICWCDFRDARPAVPELDRVLRLLAPTSPPVIDEEGFLAALVSVVRANRVLVVLDNLEAVMEPGEHAGEFQPSHRLLGSLIEALAAEGRGALFLTSRDKPSVVGRLGGLREPVQNRALRGLDKRSAIAILTRNGLPRAELPGLERVAEHHGYNPFALRIVAKSLVATDDPEFPGGLPRYLAEGCPLPEELENLLAHQVGRLSELETVCLLRATAHRTPITHALLLSDLSFRYSRDPLRRAINGLRMRGLVEVRENAFDLQNVLREYCTGRLVKEIVDQLVRGEIDRIRDVALVTPDAPEYIGEAQLRLLTCAVADGLKRRLSSGLTRHVFEMLSGLRDGGAADVGYAGGTLVNVLIAAGASLAGADLSRLTLWRCQMEGVELHDVRASDSDFDESRFSGTFGEITASAFCPDGSHLAVGTSDGSLRVWDTAMWRETPITAHAGHIRAVVFLDPAGEHVLTGGSDGALRCWNVTTSELSDELSRAHPAGVTAVAFAAGARLVAAGRDDGTLEIWEMKGKRPLAMSAPRHASRIRGIVWLDDSRLVSADEDGVLCVTTVIAGTPGDTTVIRQLSFAVWCLSFEPRIGLVMAGGAGGEIQLLAPSDLQDFRGPLTSSSSPVWAAGFAADASSLYVATSSGSVLVVDLNSNSIRDVVRAHDGWARTIACHPHGRLIATGGADRTLRIWDMDTHEAERVFRGHTRSLWAVAFSADDAFLAAGGSDGSIHVWDSSYEHVERIAGEHWIRCLAFHPARSLLAVGDDRGLRVRDIPAKRWHELSGEMGPVWDVAFSSDGAQLVSAGEDHSVRCWQIQTPEDRPVRFSPRQAPVRTHSNWVVSVAFDPSGESLASGDADGVVLVGPTRGQTARLEADRSDQVWGLAFAGDRTKLISAGRDGVVRCWHLGVEPELDEWPVEHFIWDIAVETRSDRALLAGDGNRVLEIDLSSGKVSLRMVAEGSPRIHALALATNKPLLASAGDDGRVRVWNLESDDELASLDPDRLYARFNITDVRNISNAQRASLLDLGAIDDQPALDSRANAENAPALRQSGKLELAELIRKGSVTVNVGGMNFGDRYEVKQAAAVGRGSHAENVTQIWNDNRQDIELPALAAELSELRETLSRDQASGAEVVAVMGDLAEAEIAAKSGDGPQALEYLRRVGRFKTTAQWALNAATAIGTGVAAQALRAALGLP